MNLCKTFIYRYLEKIGFVLLLLDSRANLGLKLSQSDNNEHHFML